MIRKHVEKSKRKISRIGVFQDQCADSLTRKIEH